MQFIENTISVVDLDLIFECVLRCLHLTKAIYVCSIILVFLFETSENDVLDRLISIPLSSR